MNYDQGIMREISELWIINDSGLCLFHASPEVKLDPLLFSGFITAIDEISISETSFEINDIKMKNHWLIFIRDNDTKLKFIVRAQDRNKKKRIISVLQKIHDLFFLKYTKEVIMNWNGNMDIFKEFEEELVKLFEDKHHFFK